MENEINIPRIMISADGSGSGKTTVVCGIIKAIIKRKINVFSCKCGPDYIDPMFHKKILKTESKNIDSFFCEDELLKELFYRHTKNGGFSVLEGVMGYYDGISLNDTYGSSYHIAGILKTPVILVIDARKKALTTAAVIKGLLEFKKDSNIKGVILNGISEKIYEKIKPVIKVNTGIEAIGFLPYDNEYTFESRHLGLIMPDEIEDIHKKTEKLSAAAEKCIDIDRIIEIGKKAASVSFMKRFDYNRPFEKKIKIGVAYDDAFCFYYKDNLELLKSAGCEIVYFSPLYDKKIPDGISGILLGGGYPELYLDKLSKNKELRRDIKMKIDEGMPALGECGGFMYMNDTVKDKDGRTFEMVGIVKGEAFFTKRLVRFGYINMTARRDSFLLKKGEKIKAHEFHYWDCTENGDMFLAEKPDKSKDWKCMYQYKNFIGGYPHIYYYSNTDFAFGFVKKCGEWKM